jgi:hypothetical protein
MSYSKWVGRVGAFINLESIGPGGVPIVFQHAGAWMLQEYAAAVSNPRGSIAAQVRGERPWYTAVGARGGGICLWLLCSTSRE